MKEFSGQFILTINSDRQELKYNCRYFCIQDFYIKFPDCVDPLGNVSNLYVSPYSDWRIEEIKESKEN